MVKENKNNDFIQQLNVALECGSCVAVYAGSNSSWVSSEIS